MVALLALALFAPDFSAQASSAIERAQLALDLGQYDKARELLEPAFHEALPKHPVLGVRAHALRMQIALATGEMAAFDKHRAQGRTAVVAAMGGPGLGEHDALRFEFGSEIEDSPAHRAIAAHHDAVTARANPALFTGCRGLAIGKNVLVRCPDFLAEYGRVAATTPRHRVQRFAAERFPKPLYALPWIPKPTFQTRPYLLVVDDTPLPGLRFVSYQAGMPEMQVAESQGMTVSAQTGAEQTVASCLIRVHDGHRRKVADEACPNVIATILAGAVPDSILIERPPHVPGSIAGRILTVPNGCELGDNPNVLSCAKGQGKLMWASESQGVETAEDRVRWLGTTLRAMPKWAGTVSGPHAFDCTVEDQATECLRYTRVYKHSTAHDVLAVAKLRGEKVFVSCSHKASTFGAPPPACAQVFGW